MSHAVEAIDTLLRQLSANEKAAAANTEAGGYKGQSTHPSTDADDRTGTAQTGFRSSENEKDVKKDQGSPGVDNTSEGTPGGQDSVQMNIGTNQAATGEDSSVETSSAKGGKDDGTTDHPADTENDSLDGHKYANTVLSLTKKAAEMGNELLADITVSNDEQLKQAADTGTVKSAAEGEAVGHSLSDLLIGNVGQDKQAEAISVVSALTATVREAHEMAEKTAAFLLQVEKSAEDSEDDSEDEEKGKGGSESESENPSDGVSEEPAGAYSEGEDPTAGAMSEEELMQQLMGGEDMGAGAAMGDMGGAPEGGAELPPEMPPEMPPEAATDPLAGGMGPEMGAEPMAGGMPPEMGADPMAGGMGPEMGADPMAGGMPPEAGGMPPEAGGGQNDMEMLAAILQELGISPEELQAAAMAKQAKVLREKTASSKSLNKSWKPKTAQEQKRQQATKAYIQELLG